MEDDSGLDFTSIVAPAAGRLAEIFTASGKVVPAAGVCRDPVEGVVVTVIAVSEQDPVPPPLPLPQATIPARKKIMTI